MTPAPDLARVIAAAFYAFAIAYGASHLKDVVTVKVEQAENLVKGMHTYKTEAEEKATSIGLCIGCDTEPRKTTEKP